MGQITRGPMTVDGFLRRPETEPYELVDGEVVAGAPQTAAHADAKADLLVALRRALTAERPRCRGQAHRLFSAAGRRALSQSSRRPGPGSSTIAAGPTG